MCKMSLPSKLSQYLLKASVVISRQTMNSCNFEVIVVLGLASVALLLLNVRVVRVGSGVGIQTLLPLLLLSLLHYAFLAVVTVALEQLLHALLPQQQPILVLVLFLAGGRNLVLVVVAVQHVDGHEGRVYVLLQHRHPRKALEPRMLLQLDDSVFCPQSLSRFSLNHLSKTFLTLLMKSAASIDQPAGISSLFTCTCLLRIWSLIYFLFRP